MTMLLKTRTILTMKQEIDINHRHQQHFPNLFGGQIVRLRNYSEIEMRNIYYRCSFKKFSQNVHLRKNERQFTALF